ncbi:M3 family oligoendopeptidase [Robertmurraya yapensis]|uniref:M3 family oligoendopeptidase n=1 Tax=Bacillus yapensis TaxID=2492960 RepID=A0A431W3L1_9BACI|nr:M3 family oligoendopeptidase [Bacillus yapensis]RTR30041.1 M3 family oligoendopeptidase [Bacillus yapensis]TKS95122.1 M3 family oligoendopeptidase [Bacillus yapensis]
MTQNVSHNYYQELIDLQDVEGVETHIQSLLDVPIESVSDLEKWLKDEKNLMIKIAEAMTGHQVDFYRNTEDALVKSTYLHDQQVIQPLLMKYEAKLDEKCCQSPYFHQLDEKRYGLMRRVRESKVKLFREENIPLMVKEQELNTKYSEIMGGLTVDWDGEEKPFPFIQSQLDHLDRSVREKAYHAMISAHRKIKPEMDAIMDELVQLRHQIALNAGFENYRDYMFVVKNREYSVQDCYDFHENVEKHIIPAWNRLADVFKSKLGVDTYRPWDNTAKLMKNPPYSEVSTLMDGVSEMLGKTDPYFADRFDYMREHGLLDLGDRKGKSPGGFCTSLPVSGDTFVFANFSPSFFSLIALIHEMGHAVNGYLEFSEHGPIEEYQHRMEVAELYSHGMELLLLDKLDRFYPDEEDFKSAQREELRRAFTMLIGPLSGDLFQHWMYTNPQHTAKERDEKYFEISKRYGLNPVDTSGLEAEIGMSWAGTLHYFQVPFYNIEYSISMLGALQLLENYQNNPKQAVESFKKGASADYNQSIAAIYEETGVSFDFSEPAVKRMGDFLEKVIQDIH